MMIMGTPTALQQNVSLDTLFANDPYMLRLADTLHANNVVDAQALADLTFSQFEQITQAHSIGARRRVMARLGEVGINFRD